MILSNPVIKLMAILGCGLVLSACCGVVEPQFANEMDDSISHGGSILNDTDQNVVKGHVDGIAATSLGPMLSGWACLERHNASVDVHLYVGGAYGTGTIVTSMRADQQNEPAVNAACSSNGVSHRFYFALDGLIPAYSGQGLWVHAIHPSGAGPNPVLGGSGVHLVPEDPAAGVFLPVFRWSSSREHFFTRDVRGEAAAQLGYAYEGPVFHVRKGSGSGFRPLFRLSKAIHLYTSDPQEREQALDHGYRDEGNIGTSPGRPPTAWYLSTAISTRRRATVS